MYIFHSLLIKHLNRRYFSPFRSICRLCHPLSLGWICILHLGEGVTVPSVKLVYYALHASMPDLMQNSLATLNTLKIMLYREEVEDDITFNLLDVGICFVLSRIGFNINFKLLNVIGRQIGQAFVIAFWNFFRSAYGCWFCYCASRFCNIKSKINDPTGIFVALNGG